MVRFSCSLSHASNECEKDTHFVRSILFLSRDRLRNDQKIGHKPARCQLPDAPLNRRTTMENSTRLSTRPIIEHQMKMENSSEYISNCDRRVCQSVTRSNIRPMRTSPSCPICRSLAV